MNLEDIDEDDWKFEYERKIKILSKRTFLRKKIPRSFDLVDHIPEDSAIPDRKLNYAAFVDPVKVKRIVREFIFKLKRNSSYFANDRNAKKDKSLEQIREGFFGDQFEIDLLTGIEVNSTFQTIISIVSIVLIIVAQVMATLHCFFEDNDQGFKNSMAANVLKIICLVLTLLKIGIGLMAKRWINGVQVEKITAIWRSYFRSRPFFFDVCLLITVVIVVFTDGLVFANVTAYILSLICVFHLHKHAEIIQEKLMDNKKKQYWALMKVFLSNLFFAHLITSVLFAISRYSSEHSWMVKYQISEETWGDKYLYGYYWAATILTTVGFGDITPANPTEAISVSLIMLTGTLFLSFNISEIGAILQSMRDVEKEVKNDLATFKRLARAMKISKKLQGSIVKYIVNSADIKSTFEFENRNKILHSLPEEMSVDFREEASNAMFLGIPFLHLLEEGTKVSLSEELKPKIFSPEQYITKRGVGLTKIYILRLGECGFAYQKGNSSRNGSIISSQKVESETSTPYFMNKYFMKPARSINYSIIAKTYCLCFEGDFNSFLGALRKHQKDFQYFKQIQDSVDINEHEYDTSVCPYCEQDLHSVFSCPKIQYMPLRDLVVVKHIKKLSIHQHRGAIRFERQRRGLIKKSPIKMWKAMFKQFEEVLSISDCRNNSLKLMKMQSAKNQLDFGNAKPVFEAKMERNLLVDSLRDFGTYFKKMNPQKLTSMSLRGKRANIFLQDFQSKFLQNRYQLHASANIQVEQLEEAEYSA